MSGPPAYLFRTPGQWSRGETMALSNEQVLSAADGSVVAELSRVGQPAIGAGGGEVYLVDDNRLIGGACPGPDLAGACKRLVVGPQRIWALLTDVLHQFDRSTLQALDSWSAIGILDCAGDGRDGLWLLHEDPPRISRIDAAGRAVTVAPGAEPGDGGWNNIGAIGETLLLLAGDKRSLLLVAGGRRRLDFAEALGGLVPDWGTFAGDALSGGDDAVLIRGLWGSGQGKVPGFVIADAMGAIVARGRWQGAAPTTLALDGRDVLAAFATDLRRFPGSAARGGELRLIGGLATEAPAGNWLRADVTAALPEGATLSLRYAAIEEPGLATLLEALRTEADRTPAQRIAAVAGRIGRRWQPAATYRGRAGAGGPEQFSFLLSEAARGATLWLELRLDGNGAEGTAGIEALAVLHDGEGLMEHLPAIYRGSGDADGSLRRLVGVLEATTQTIDDRIAGLGARLDPELSEARWLPALATMLGLPFDAALTDEMRRRLVCAAPAILGFRGTRRGLLGLLAALLPGRPFRVFDRSAAFATVTLGANALPARLAGPSAGIPRLNARLVLGRTRLRRAGPCDDRRLEPAPEVIVTIPADARERRLWGDALRQMIEAMVPAGVRPVLRWTGWRGGAAEATDPVLAIVEMPRPLCLGDGTPLGAATLGGRRAPRIAPDGFAAVGHRLL